MTLRLVRRLEKLEIQMAPVKTLRVYWVDPEAGTRELIAVTRVGRGGDAGLTHA